MQETEALVETTLECKWGDIIQDPTLENFIYKVCPKTQELFDIHACYAIYQCSQEAGRVEYFETSRKSAQIGITSRNGYIVMYIYRSFLTKSRSG